MLYYSEVSLSPYEVPDHVSICIYISGCCNRCAQCHYPLLQKSDYGDSLLVNFIKIVELYQNQATCVCFLGEGENTSCEHREFSQMVEIAKRYNIRTCLYCGRDTTIEEWMHIFDFVKIGSYHVESGGLNDKRTNQKFFKKSKNGYINITYKFWK